MKIAIYKEGHATQWNKKEPVAVMFSDSDYGSIHKSTVDSSISIKVKGAFFDFAQLMFRYKIKDLVLKVRDFSYLLELED